MESRHIKTSHFLHQGLFDAVSSFSDLEGRIENLETTQEKGDAFEVFAQAYLATQKIVQAKTVWSFEHLPENLKQKVAIDTPRDMGVDGAFETVTSQQCAYQVKFRTGRASLPWKEVSTFMGLTEQVDERVLFTNSEEIPELMDDRKSFYCIRGSDLDRLEQSDFDAIKAWLEAGYIEIKRHDPKPHQREALQAIESAFKEADRATVVMACGTGKTLVQLWAAESLDVGSVLVLVPSLALVRQTLHEWLKQTKWENYSYLCVCSDPSVKGGDEVIVKQSELDFPVTTNSAEVARYLNTSTKGPHVVFSTYQSAKVVAEGMPRDYVFDLGFFDEAHKTAGREGTRFAYALTNENLRISKRLFMTATPRHYDVRKKDKEGDSKLVYSMDVPEIYGETAYSLQFREAVNQDLICGYKVLISVVADKEIDNWQLSHGEVVVKGDAVKARQVANQIAIKNAVDKYGVHRIFTFHSSVASAKSFTSAGGEGVNSELPDFLAVHVNGAMPASKRSHIMREFEQAPQAVISNARCLTEGVDVPAVDMVAFMSPKKSKVDIVQATGRAMRKSSGKEVGYVLMPLYLEQEKDESVEEAVERADFSEVWNVLQAMKEQDEDLADVIREIQEERGKTGGYDDSRLRERMEVLGPALNQATLRNAVVTQCVERLGESWDLRFGELVGYKEEHGDCNIPAVYPQNQRLSKWVHTQRGAYNNGSLKPERIRHLEEIGFEWDLISAAWVTGFKELIAYKEEHGDCNVPRRYSKKPQLSNWIRRQRQEYKNGKLDSDRVRRLEEQGFIWNTLSALWEQRYKELATFKEEHGGCNVPVVYAENSQLGRWVHTQRRNYNNGNLEPERIRRLEEMGFEWGWFSTVWEKRFKELTAYKEEHGNCNVPKEYSKSPQLVEWVSRQRVLHKKGELLPEDVKQLDLLDFEWNPVSAVWEKRFKELTAYKEEHGNCNVPFEYSKSPQLGSWVGWQRQQYKKGKLSADQVRRLTDLGFEWNPVSAVWETRFKELVAYKEKHGDCKVPRSYSKYPQLGQWVSTQRQAYSNGSLEAERIRRLEEIGFVWDPISTEWNTRFTELIAYREENMDCNVPRHYAKCPQLGDWVNTQRARHKNGKLDADRAKRLEEIGFIWNTREKAE